MRGHLKQILKEVRELRQGLNRMGSQMDRMIEKTGEVDQGTGDSFDDFERRFWSAFEKAWMESE